MTKKNYLFDLLILSIIILLIINPAIYSASAFKGVSVWATVLVPSLFPFIFFAKIFSISSMSKTMSSVFSPLTKKLYNTAGVSANIFLLSILSGYPIGAKLTADYYHQGAINLGQAKRICAFTSNTGPMFIIGTVGIGFLQSFKAGLIIYLCHIFGAILNGLIYRKRYLAETKTTQTIFNNQTKTTLGEMALSSVFSILTIGVFVCIFFVIGEMVFNLKLLLPLEIVLEKIGISKSLTQSVVAGLLEMTKGTLMLSTLQTGMILKTVITCFLITFGGLSTFLQAYSFLGEIGVKKRDLFIQKITHSAISTALCVIMSIIFL